MLKKTGDRGEKYALKYLKKNGFKIVETNYRALRGEIDIIAREGDTLVFIEVKTNSASGAIPPEMRVNTAKQNQIGKIARAYLQDSKEEPPDCRFDVIGVILQGERDYKISHIRDAFWLQRNV